MLVDRIIYPIKTLGPGKRIAVWTMGCSKHCFRCSNPELWPFKKENDIDIYRLADILIKITKSNDVDGITFTGGDPMEQAEEMACLLQKICEFFDDIIIYTGFRLEDLERNLPVNILTILKDRISILIDGPYIDCLNDGKSAMIGSVNQRHIFFDKTKMEKYKKYCINFGRKIQNVYYDKGIISVGIHNTERGHRK